MISLPAATVEPDLGSWAVTVSPEPTVRLMKPALFSAGLFQFLWTYNDYFNSLIFISTQRKYPISLALRMSLDSESVVNWGKVMAMAFVAVLPVMLLFFAAQKYFVEGIATTGLKG